jgi:glycosyltransferase involved in cell wall biosynthesis
VTGRLVVVLKGYPRLSETFIAQELRALELAGARLSIVAMRHPHDAKTHPIHSEIEAPVSYLPEYLHRDIGRVLVSLWRARRLPGFRLARRQLARDIVPSRDRLRRFGQAAVLAVELPADATAIYAHFIHTPSSVARYASLISGLPWMCSAHAKDIWTSPDWDLAAKLGAATWTVTCTAVGHARLAGLAVDQSRVRLMYHGLDLARFAAVERLPATRDGSDPSRPVEVLAVGRAVPKKGLDILVDALAQLPADLHWRLTHIGGGAERDPLAERAIAAGVADRITWAGAMDQPAVLDAYRRADLFVLPCRVTASGDRDGLPNVLMEAQSQGLACLSTTVGGVGELIINGETGTLVPPDDAGAMAAALSDLMRHPDRRARLGRGGQDRVRRHFDAASTITLLLELLALGRRSTTTQPDAIAPLDQSAPHLEPSQT